MSIKLRKMTPSEVDSLPDKLKNDPRLTHYTHQNNSKLYKKKLDKDEEFVYVIPDSK